MDAQKIKFMMSIQQEIDKLKAKLGASNSFVVELKKQFDLLSQSELNKQINSDYSSNDLAPIKIDTKTIRESLEIRGEYSVDYSFVTNSKVQKQLMIDNLRMENSFLDTTLKIDIERFYIFCVNAFYQIEEILNFYYHVKSNSIEDLIKAIENNPKIKFIRSDKMKNVGDISTYHKMELFCSTNFTRKETTVFHNIRNVRNEEMHRCSVVVGESKNLFEKYEQLLKRKKEFNFKNRDTKQLYTNTPEDWEIENEISIPLFLKDRNFTLVRKSVSNLTEVIKQKIIVNANV